MFMYSYIMLFKHLIIISLISMLCTFFSYAMAPSGLLLYRRVGPFFMGQLGPPFLDPLGPLFIDGFLVLV